MVQTSRDHLFVSYASEDAAFAEWLTLRLTGEGYKVWCDRIKLLGGEAYPTDIDRAIKDNTFRLLSVLSRDSNNKPNPVKERTLALNLGRDRGEEFVIPLNLDGLSAAELNWMVADLTFVPFQHGWAVGLSQLLKKLASVGAPRPLANGREVVSEWFADRDNVSRDPERLWTNLFEIEALPSTLLRLTFVERPPDDVLAGWPHYSDGRYVFWAFEAPPQRRRARSPGCGGDRLGCAVRGESTPAGECRDDAPPAAPTSALP